MKALLLLLLLATIAESQTTYYTNKQATRRFWRTIPRGSDSNTCEQAKNPATARSTINGGISCLQPGDILRVGAGTYKELLLASYNGNTVCSASDAAVQQPCAIIPNGVSEARLTQIIGDGEVVISPETSLPGGGGTLTLYDISRYMHFEGLRFVNGGVHLGNSQYIIFHGNELSGGDGTTGALLSSSQNSRYLTLTKNEIHHAGESCNPRVQTSPPCPHGIYVCGQDHWIADNYVHHNSNFGIQVSCEHGGIERVTVAMNKVEYNKGTGIRISGNNNKAFANQLVRNGLGMTITGNNVLVAHNTFDGIHELTAYDDPFGLWMDPGDVTIVNNIFTNQRNSWYMMQIRDGSNFRPVDPNKVHHNGCDIEGNVGCTNIHPTNSWYIDYESGDYSLSTTSPAKAAGVNANVEVDIIHHAYLAPDLGSYAFGITPTPIPPTPTTKLNCAGELGAKGAITMTCTPAN